MTKERLRAYRHLERERRDLEERIRELRASMTAPRGAPLSGLPHAPGPGGSIIEGQVARLYELEQCYAAKIGALTDALLEIEQAIDALPTREQTLLRLHYVDGLTWEEVGDSMGYSWRQTHRIHAYALQRLQDQREETDTHAT